MKVKNEQRISSQIREVSPCKDCTEKFPACHGKCPKDDRGEFGYGAWLAEIKRVKASRKEYERNLPKKKSYY